MICHYKTNLSGAFRVYYYINERIARYEHKEQYWKYSLIVIILFMGVIIFRQITPFLGGLLGALTMYILVRTHMNYLTEKRKMKRSISALLITAETIMVFLVPLGLIIG